jgi:hypothetical protein
MKSVLKNIIPYWEKITLIYVQHYSAKAAKSFIVLEDNTEIMILNNDIEWLFNSGFIKAVPGSYGDNFRYVKTKKKLTVDDVEKRHYKYTSKKDRFTRKTQAFKNAKTTKKFNWNI